MQELQPNQQPQRRRRRRWCQQRGEEKQLVLQSLKGQKYSL